LIKRTKIYTVAIFLIFSGWTSVQAAGGLLVRSGEHKDFSRLVFDLKPSTDWNLKQVKGGYELSFDPKPSRFDISRIFQFVPKTRLISVALKVGKPGTLLLDVAPNYHAEIVRTPAGKLVVDIKSGADVVSFKPPIPSDASRLKSTNLQSRSQKYPLQPSLPEPSAPPILGTNPAPEPATTQPVSPPPSNLPNIRVLKAQQKLVAQLGRAMTQGIIVPDQSRFFGNISPLKRSLQSPPPSLKPPSRPEGKTSPAKEKLVKALAQDIRNQLNLIANTVYDRGWVRSPDPINVKIADVVCISNRDLDLASWTDDKPVDQEIAKLRLGLTGEFDKTNIDTLTSLVKLYIARGFGTEAKALMSTFGVKLDNEDLYYDLADIIETGGVTQSRILASQSICPSASAMWAVLARSKIPVGEVPNPQILNKYFSELPANLRQRIGPFLGEKLLNAGLIGEAQQIAKLIARAPGDPSPQTTLFAAKLSLARKKPEKAKNELLSLIESDETNSPEALLLLMNVLLHSPKPVPEYLITETAARAFELRYSSQGQALLRLEILAWAHDQNQSKAFEILNHATSLQTLDAQAISEIASEIFLSFNLQNLGSQDFVSMFFQHRHLLSKNPDMDAARLHAAKGLLQAGLPDVALNTLVPLTARLTSTDRQLIAKIYLAEDKPQAAIRILSPDRSKAAARLRISAFSKNGAYDKALAIASAENLLRSESELAWKAGQWDVAAQSDVLSRRQAASYYLQATKDGPTAQATSSFEKPMRASKKLSLAQLEGMVKSSQNTRAELKTLLSDNPFP